MGARRGVGLRLMERVLPRPLDWRYLPLLLYAGVMLAVVFTYWPADDFGAYWEAALRLRAGEPLYTPMANSAEVYRYAPWFAYLWVPLTHLPRDLVEALWTIILLGAVAASLAGVMRYRYGLVAALLLGPWLLWTAGWGNAHALLIAALVWSLPTRAGPWVVGITGSLKLIPLLIVPLYLVRRQWMSAAIALGVAAVLWAPVLLLGGYPSSDRPLYWYDATWLLVALPRPHAMRRM